MGAALDNRSMIRLLVGLGNPGPEYEATRHNAGFWFVDEAARKLGATLAARTVLCRPRGARQPAGRPVVAAPADDLHEPVGQVGLRAGALLQDRAGGDPRRPRRARSDAGPGQAQARRQRRRPQRPEGHRGAARQAGFWRLRLGIGHPGVKAEVVDYVLRKPPADQREAIDKSIEQSIAALDLVLAGDMERAMMKVHAKPPRPEAGRRAERPRGVRPRYAGGVVVKRIAAAAVVAIALVAGLAGVPATAQTVYRCGNTYGPAPAPKARRSMPTTRAPARSGPRRSGWPPTSDGAATRWSARGCAAKRRSGRRWRRR